MALTVAATATCESAELWDAQAASLPVVRVAVDTLVIDDSPRLDGEDEEHIQQLAQHAAPLPPIIVHRATSQVIDGAHRLRAAQLNGQTHIDVQYFDGVATEAFLLAVNLNARHGLPLTRSDRNAAALRIVQSHPEWSDRMIATVAGLSPKTVGAIRRRSGDAVPQLNVRVGLDGKSRVVDTAERRRLAGEYALAHPEASLREIAKASGLSLATARDVRERIQKGTSPLLPARRGATVRAPQDPSDDAPATPFAIAETLHTLRRDPSLRLTDHGRFLLRLLDTNAVANNRWSELVDQIPPHWVGQVASAARECAAAWRLAAQQLEERARSFDDVRDRAPMDTLA
ncbi:ParB/RepB/Spo0J family partition protein [Streptomyces sp. NPDC058442]|uniref:ParB/RepB/Spo0J family partition protein n=1 Tax=Streptomyces sp. NPDC058442 TaxID=3346503 RepID=UPI00366A1B2D